MRVMHVTDKPRIGGGLARQVADLMDALRRRGHEVGRLRLLDPERPSEGEEDPTVASAFDPLRSALRVRELLDAADRFRPDVVHCHAGYTSLGPLLLRALRRRHRVVGTLHDVRPFCFRASRRFRNQERLCDRHVGWGCLRAGCAPFPTRSRAWTLARAGTEHWALAEWKRLHAVVVPSAYLGRLSRFHGFSEARLRVITPFTALPQEQATHAPGALARIAYVGALTREKGIHDFLAALERLRELDWEADVMGDGPDRSALERGLAGSPLQPRVHWHGRVDEAERTRLLARARVAVVPSRIPESFGLAGIEALAVGVPVVSYGLGGIGEWFADGENGIRASPFDVGSLADGIRTLVLDREHARDLGDRGRRQVGERFQEKRCVGEHEHVYHAAASC
jgi:glycosyltransferase involved in cell wall biosynthesis